MPLSLDGTGSITGIGTFNFSDEIVHVGDTDTKIRFPSVDTISLETAGSERVRIKSDGKVLITNTLGLGGATSNPGDLLHAQSTSGEGKIVIIGATTMQQLKTDIESVNVKLTDEIIKEINEVQKIYPNPCP